MMFFKKKKTQPIEDDEVSESSTPKTSRGGRGGALADFVMRIVAAIATLGSAIAMAKTTNHSLPFLQRFIRSRAEYHDLPTFTLFVAANAIASCYLVLSLALSIFHILKSGSRITRGILIIFDTVMLAFLTSGASAAAAIAHLAHKGNAWTNWVAICHQYNSFCQRISGSLAASFIGILVLLLLILMSSMALSRS